MKKLLLLFITISSLAQIKQPNTDFYLENGKVYWQHVYDVPGKNIEDLIKYFEKEVLINIKQDNFQIIDNTISFTVSDDKINFKKYGGTAIGTAFIAQLNMNYLVIVDFKEEKYRVTVKDIFLDNKQIGLGHLSGNIEEFCLKKSNTLFTTNKVTVTGLIYDHNHFLEKFEIKQTAATKNW